MSLLAIIITLVIVGVVLYIINRFVPMEPSIKNILNIVVIIILALWLLKAFGLFSYLSDVKL